MGKWESALESLGIKDNTVTETFWGLYKNKTILITGHSGFKGSWLTLWLSMLGANIVGYSAYYPSNPCNFKVCKLGNRIINVKGDVRNIEKLFEVFSRYKPEIIFHLAAQPIVSKSYDNPKLTFDVNVGGTINILECIRFAPSVKAAVIITSDKCYQNVEWMWGYRENDRLGGDDPYSASKAAAEIACHAYIKSFFTSDDSTKISTTRAGNVIGGGDWAEARIVPDCVKAWSKGKEVYIRNPQATRPWQHVLEPLGGYLLLGANLILSRKFHNEAFNFGPNSNLNKSVAELIETFITYWGNAKWIYEQIKTDKKESKLLKLSCDKALHLLDWYPVLSFDDTIRLTAEWYKAYYKENRNMFDYSVEQIKYYVSEATKQNLLWTKGGNNL